MEQEFWNQRYEDEQTGWNLGAASPPLATYVQQLEDKSLSILIPGCGFGHEVRLLSELGFSNVTALDFVPEALENIRNLPGVTCVNADFFTHSGSYDLILEQTLFCAIDPRRRDNYVEKVYQLLKPGGKLVGVLFNRDFEGGPPFGGSKAEYSERFGKKFTQLKIEDCYNSAKPRIGTEVFISAEAQL